MWAAAAVAIAGPAEVVRGRDIELFFQSNPDGMIRPDEVVWSFDQTPFDMLGTTISSFGGPRFRLSAGIGEGEEGDRTSSVIVRVAVIGAPSIYAQHTVWLTGPRERGEWRFITIGQDHTLGITWYNELYTWGRGIGGQLGRPNTIGEGSTILEARARPGFVNMGQGHNWLTVTGGLFHSVGLRHDGALYTWGRNNHGQLGRVTTGDTYAPGRVGTGLWSHVAAGSNHTLGIMADGSLWAWGTNVEGQLGTGDNVNQPSPTRVGSGGQHNWRWSSVSTNAEHSVAIRTDGTLWTWGQNQHDQLGHTGGNNNTLGEVSHPTAGRTWVAASAGDGFTVALDDQDRLWAWGNDAQGQLGPNGPGPGAAGLATRTHIPVEVPQQGGRGWRSINIGHHHTMAIDADRRLFAWGSNSHGQVTYDTARGAHPDLIEVPAQGPHAGLGWVSASGGGWYSLAVQADGTLWAWGANDHGQIGNGLQASATANTPITQISRYAIPGPAAWR
ncbi:MAG: hypothetical protein FWC64_01915 [Treponema sp.]|nr:hypothetical protein [Treponema sp.]